MSKITVFHEILIISQFCLKILLYCGFWDGFNTGFTKNMTNPTRLKTRGIKHGNWLKTRILNTEFSNFMIFSVLTNFRILAPKLGSFWPFCQIREMTTFMTPFMTPFNDHTADTTVPTTTDTTVLNPLRPSTPLARLLIELRENPEINAKKPWKSREIDEKTMKITRNRWKYRYFTEKWTRRVVMGYHLVPHRVPTTHYPGTTSPVHHYPARSCRGAHPADEQWSEFTRLLLVSTLRPSSMFVGFQWWLQWCQQWWLQWWQWWHDKTVIFNLKRDWFLRNLSVLSNLWLFRVYSPVYDQFMTFPCLFTRLWPHLSKLSVSCWLALGY